MSSEFAPILFFYTQKSLLLYQVNICISRSLFILFCVHNCVLEWNSSTQLLSNHQEKHFTLLWLCLGTAPSPNSSHTFPLIYLRDTASREKWPPAHIHLCMKCNYFERWGQARVPSVAFYMRQKLWILCKLMEIIHGRELVLMSHSAESY